MLRYKADIRTLVFLGAYYTLFIATWFFIPHTWTWMVPAITLLCVLNFMVAITIHNTVHSPVFYHEGLNTVLRILLTCAFGSPASGYVPGHNLSHHKHLQTEYDNTRTSKMRFRWNFLNQLLFFFIMIPGIVKTENRYVKRVGKYRRRWITRYRAENIFCWCWRITWLLVDWRLFLLVLMVPNLYAVWGIFGTNFWQHDGCDETHAYNHSRNFTGKLFNFLVCNNGYHGAHHMRPAMHWSLYPKYHEEKILPHLHPSLDQKSILKYLWITCIYPAKRVDYLGNPLKLKPPVKDGDWVADIKVPAKFKRKELKEA